MDQQARQDKLEHDHEAAKFQFIATELDLALTFCEMAITTNDETKAERTTEYARQAYGAAKRFILGAHFGRQMNEEINDRLTRLEPLMQRLGLVG